MIQLLVLPGGLPGLDRTLLSSKQVSFELGKLVLDLMSVDDGADCSPPAVHLWSLVAPVADERRWL